MTLRLSRPHDREPAGAAAAPIRAGVGTYGDFLSTVRCIAHKSLHRGGAVSPDVSTAAPGGAGLPGRWESDPCLGLQVRNCTNATMVHPGAPRATSQSPSPPAPACVHTLLQPHSAAQGPPVSPITLVPSPPPLSTGSREHLGPPSCRSSRLKTPAGKGCSGLMQKQVLLDSRDST